MEDHLKTLLNTLQTALESGEGSTLNAVVENVHPADIAEVFSLLDEEEQSQLIYSLPAQIVAEVLTELDEADRGEVVEDMDDVALSAIVTELSPDDAADVLGELTKEQRDEVLDQIPEAQSKQIEELLEYDEESAGGIMTPELIALPETASVAAAVEQVRRLSENEEIHYVYVVDAQMKLIGLVPLRRLVTNTASVLLRDICERDPVTANVSDDQEHVAHMIARYDVSALPIVDDEGKLVGRVTHDDVYDVAEEEADEDMYYMAGTDASELEDQSVLRAWFIRFRWLMSCMLGTTCTAGILAYFEEPFPKEMYLALVFFVPMMGAMGGNSGIQISTIIVRALATGDWAATKVAKTFAREGRITLVMAPTCGVVAGTICRIGAPLLQEYQRMSPDISTNRLALSVGVGMTSAIIVAGLLGMTLPHLFRKIGVDPAIASGPIVTTANDVVSTSAYFLIAFMIMR